MRARVTEKVMCALEDREPVPSALEERNSRLVRESIEAAGWAPFHYPRDVDGIAEPWRVHLLGSAEAHQAARHLADRLQVTTKEPKLAAACSALALVTWLPERPAGKGAGDSAPLAQNLAARNEEHLAAASAMTQNLLLMLTAHGMGTYWSSGGKFRSPEMFAYLQIPSDERLLAAIFIEYPEMKESSPTGRERKPGAQRNNRSQGWIRVVDLPPSNAG